MGGQPEFSLGAIAKRHFTIPVLNRCGADVVNAHAGLDLTAAWGERSVAAVDGTMMDTVIDNLLAETSIRYGGYGGIAHGLQPHSARTTGPAVPRSSLFMVAAVSRSGVVRTASAEKLEEALSERLPARSVLEHLARATGPGQPDRRPPLEQCVPRGRGRR